MHDQNAVQPKLIPRILGKLTSFGEINILPISPEMATCGVPWTPMLIIPFDARFQLEKYCLGEIVFDLTTF